MRLQRIIFETVKPSKLHVGFVLEFCFPPRGGTEGGVSFMISRGYTEVLWFAKLQFFIFRAVEGSCFLHPKFKIKG